MSTDISSEARELVGALQDYFGSYHHHKEQMAFGAAGLYIAGAATLALQTKASTPTSPWVVVALVCSAVFGSVFVWWQFRMRASAARIVGSATKILSTDLRTLLKVGVTQPELNSEEHTLVAHIEAQGILRSPLVSELVTYAVMLAWTLAAWCRC